MSSTDRKYIMFHNDAGGGQSHGYRQQAQKLVKIALGGSRDILVDRQTDTHIQTYSSQYFSTAPTGKVTIIKETISFH